MYVHTHAHARTHAHTRTQPYACVQLSQLQVGQLKKRKKNHSQNIRPNKVAINDGQKEKKISMMGKKKKKKKKPARTTSGQTK